jgi:hypothetical protein
LAREVLRREHRCAQRTDGFPRHGVFVAGRLSQE